MSEEKRRRFEEAQLIQDYFQVLKELVSKKSVFDQQTGLVETAAYLKDVFLAAGAEVLVDDSYAAPFVLATFSSSNPDAKSIIFYNHYKPSLIFVLYKQ